MKVEVVKWKTNGKTVKDSHAFNATFGAVNFTFEQKALCGKKIPGFFNVNSRKIWGLKRITCPGCREKARGAEIIP